MQCGRHEYCISSKWASMWWRYDLLCLSLGGINKNIHLPIFYGYSVSGKVGSNFPDKYFVLGLCSFCLEQFHLFQNYTGQGSSLITAADKFWNQWQWCELIPLENCSGFLVLYVSMGLAKNICFWTTWERKIRTSVQQGNFAVSSASTVKGIAVGKVVPVLQSCY